MNTHNLKYRIKGLYNGMIWHYLLNESGRLCWGDFGEDNLQFASAEEAQLKIDKLIKTQHNDLLKYILKLQIVKLELTVEIVAEETVDFSRLNLELSIKELEDEIKAKKAALTELLACRKS